MTAAVAAFARIRSVRGTFGHLPVIPLAILAVFVAGAVFAPLLSPHDPLMINLAAAFTPPAYADGGSTTYLLGTDNLGRDILSRILYGGRVSLVLAVVVLAIGATVGTALGLVSGFLGGRIDSLVQRFIEAILSLPTLLVALVFVFVLGRSFASVVLILSPFIAARFARMVRGDVLAIRGLGYVDLARVAGASGFRIMRRHILPNVTGTIIVLVTLEVGDLILVSSSLGFLGVGVPPPTPEWGSMVSAGRKFLATHYWLSVFPGLAIIGTVLSFNLLGDWLRDVLDPRRQHR